MKTVTATEMKNNFGKYLKLTMEGEEIIVMKNVLDLIAMEL